MKRVDFEIDWEFVDDLDLREVIEAFHRHALDAYEEAVYPATVFLSGAVLEGILCWALIKSAPLEDRGQELRLRSSGVAKLITMATKADLMSHGARAACWGLKEYRNLIHMGSAVLETTRPNGMLAVSALAGLSEVARSVRGRIARIPKQA